MEKKLIQLGNGNMVWEYKCDYCDGWGRAQYLTTTHPNPDANGSFCSTFCSVNHARVAEGLPLLVKSGKKQRSY